LSRQSRVPHRPEVLSLLLDEHISERVAAQLRAVRPDIAIASLHHWEGGDFLEARDEVILAAAHEHGLTLVTYDQSSIPDLLTSWGEQGRSHSGVIFVNDRTVARVDFGGLIRALCRLYDVLGSQSWQDRIVHLTGVPKEP
jgi:hypothetical protein